MSDQVWSPSTDVPSMSETFTNDKINQLSARKQGFLRKRISKQVRKLKQHKDRDYFHSIKTDNDIDNQSVHSSGSCESYYSTFSSRSISRERIVNADDNYGEDIDAIEVSFDDSGEMELLHVLVGASPTSNTSTEFKIVGNSSSWGIQTAASIITNATNLTNHSVYRSFSPSNAAYLSRLDTANSSLSPSHSVQILAPLSHVYVVTLFTNYSPIPIPYRNTIPTQFLSHRNHHPKGQRQLLRMKTNKSKAMYGQLPNHRAQRTHGQTFHQEKPKQNKIRDQIDSYASLLEHHTVFDEEQALKSELKKCNQEIQAVKVDLQQWRNPFWYSDEITSSTLSKDSYEQSNQDSYEEDEDEDSNNNSSIGNDSSSFTPMIQHLWDINTFLDQSTYKSSSQQNHRKQLQYFPMAQQRKFLQRKRGILCHANFPLEEIRRTFISQSTRNASHNMKTFHMMKQSLVTLPNLPTRVTSTVFDVRHMAITTSARGTSFVLCYDNGTSYWHPRYIPVRLLDKIQKKKASQSSVGNNTKIEFRYLSTGPNGSYFVELNSGECWWGIDGNDHEFDEIISMMDVHRVAFGPCTLHSMGGDCKRVETSWIVVSKDGHVAFRNIPLRLQHLLKNRAAAAPISLQNRNNNDAMTSIAEVSLGEAGSYFVRFLDGTIDYVLPSFIADVCDTVLENGSTIFSLALHPESPQDFILRYGKCLSKPRKKLSL